MTMTLSLDAVTARHLCKAMNVYVEREVEDAKRYAYDFELDFDLVDLINRIMCIDRNIQREITLGGKDE